MRRMMRSLPITGGPILNLLLFVVMLSFRAAAQPPSQSLKPVTVCEVLMNQQTYNGKNVAVIGRFGQTDEGRWLTEDTCDRKLVTNGFVWSNLIWVECCYQPALE